MYKCWTSIILFQVALAVIMYAKRRMSAILADENARQSAAVLDRKRKS